MDLTMSSIAQTDAMMRPADTLVTPGDIDSQAHDTPSLTRDDTAHGWGCDLCGIHEETATIEEARRLGFRHGMMVHDAFEPPRKTPRGYRALRSDG